MVKIEASGQIAKGILRKYLINNLPINTAIKNNFSDVLSIWNKNGVNRCII